MIIYGDGRYGLLPTYPQIKTDEVCTKMVMTNHKWTQKTINDNNEKQHVTLTLSLLNTLAAG